jgi:ornithine decarboxylase
VKDLRYAASVGVTKMTFDNEAELYKVKEYHPSAELVLRLLADDSGSKMKFGVKFGAPQVQVEGLLRTAKALHLKVIGTSFHIGSGCMEASAYEKAIALSRHVFDLGVALGMPRFTFLDLGGGYPGNPNENERSDDTPAFEEMTAVIRPSLERHFPAGCGVEVIGEPGRYMATAWSTLFVLVQGKREEPKRDPKDAAEKRKFLYYINDGVYGSFNSIMYDHAHPEPVPAYRFMSDKMSLDRRVHAQQHPYLSTSVPQATALATSFFSGALDAPQQSLVGARAFHTTFGRDRDCVGTFFGPTCDSMDVVATDFPCEELFVGDWLAFQHSGAYTSAAATTFNGMQKATATYCRSRQTSPNAQ